MTTKRRDYSPYAWVSRASVTTALNKSMRKASERFKAEAQRRAQCGAVGAPIQSGAAIRGFVILDIQIKNLEHHAGDTMRQNRGAGQFEPGICDAVG